MEPSRTELENDCCGIESDPGTALKQTFTMKRKLKIFSLNEEPSLSRRTVTGLARAIFTSFYISLYSYGLSVDGGIFNKRWLRLYQLRIFVNNEFRRNSLSALFIVGNSSDGGKVSLIFQKLYQKYRMFIKLTILPDSFILIEVTISANN